MSLVETAATPRSQLVLDPTLGLGTTCQVVPSQCSISALRRVALLFWKSPTAQMSLAETAATPRSKLEPDPSLELGTTSQLMPSQCSISVWSVSSLWASPTAQMSLAEMAATP